MRIIIVLLSILLLVPATYGAEPWVNDADMLDEINGNIVDYNGKPASGAIIQWKNADFFMPNLGTTAVTADENGNFRIPANMKNVFEQVLCVSNPDGTLINEYRIGGNASMLELDPKAVQDESSIHGVTYSLQSTRQITGVVLDLNGNPVQGASIYSPFFASRKDVVQSDENGKFTTSLPRFFGNLIYITVFKPNVGIAIVNMNNREYAVKNEAVAGEEKPYQLPQAVVLEKPFGPVKVQVVDKDGKPIPSVAVAHFMSPVDVSEPNDINTLYNPWQNVYFREMYPFAQKTDSDGIAEINVPNPNNLSRTVFAIVANPFSIPCKHDAETWSRTEDGIIRITAADLNTVRGILKTSDGTPVANGRVFGKIFQSYPDPMEQVQKISCAVTDSSGRYELPIRPLESLFPLNPKVYDDDNDEAVVPYNIAAPGDNLCTSTLTLKMRFDKTRKCVIDIPDDKELPQFGINVRKSDSNDIYCDLTQREMTTISGKVQYGSTPVEGRVVQLELISDTPGFTDIGVQKINSVSTKDGSYTLQAPPGKYKIVLYHESGYKHLTPAAVSIETDGRHIICTPDDAKPEILTITDSKQIVHNIKSSQSVAVVEGVLLSVDGKPLADEYVHLHLVAISKHDILQYYYSMDAPYNAVVQTDQDGQFRFLLPPEAPDTPHKIVAMILSSTRWEEAAGFVVIAKDDFELPVVLKHKPYVSLSGRLIDAKTGEPYANRKIFVENPYVDQDAFLPDNEIPDERIHYTCFSIRIRGNSETQTDEDGRFTVENLADDLVYRFSVAKNIPDQFEDIKLNYYMPRTMIGSVIMSNLDENKDMGDVKMMPDATQLQPSEYYTILAGDTRTFIEKLENAKQRAKNENKQILVLVTYNGQNPLEQGADYQSPTEQFMHSFYSDNTTWDYVLVIARHFDDPRIYNRDDKETLKKLGLTNNEKRQPMLCLLDADGKIINKMPLITLTNSDEEWMKFFTK